MKKPRILMIAPLPPPVHGSAMVSQYIVDSPLVNEAFDIDVVNMATARKVEEVGKTTPAKMMRYARNIMRTLGLLLRHRYSACYLAITCHGGSFIKDSAYVWLCKLLGRNIIIHQHNKGMSADVDRWPYRWLLPKTYQKTRVVLLSWHLYPDIERVVPRRQVTVCPNGIPAPQDAELTAIPHETARILFLSNLIPEKGVYDLLDACALLDQEGIDYECVYVGADTQQIDADTFAKAIRDRNLQGKVRWLGKKYGEEKDHIFRSSDIFALPTRYGNECFPLVLLEAMSYGLPVVATPEGGISDIVDAMGDAPTGFLVDGGDTPALARRLKDLLLSPDLRRKMGESGRQKYLRHYTSEAFQERITQILASAANCSSSTE